MPVKFYSHPLRFTGIIREKQMYDSVQIDQEAAP